MEQIPEQWKRSVLSCRPSAKDKEVKQPRPEVFWPVDALELAEGLDEVLKHGSGLPVFLLASKHRARNR